MNYTSSEANGQLKFSDEPNQYLMIPSGLTGFNNSDTRSIHDISGREILVFTGEVHPSPQDGVCPRCGHTMQVNAHLDTKLHHLNFGSFASIVVFERTQFRCPDCGSTQIQALPFRSESHRITKQLETYTMELLAKGTYTLKQVAEITGLGKNVVKAIDKERLQNLYTIDGETLIQPEEQAKYLGIDEFKLHDGYKFATHIIDIETGHVLWIAEGKKKQVVYDFIDHVGLDWMKGVEAVACDMNSDFQEAFQEMCPHIRIVFDRFHIIKNFNEKVVAKVRIEEQQRLKEAGDEAAARSLKRSKYVLMSSRDTLRSKDEEAAQGKTVHNGSELFQVPEYVRKGGNEARYQDLIDNNHLFFTMDLVKELLSYAYTFSDDDDFKVPMADIINEVIDLCNDTGNEHFKWFARMLRNHFDGIVAYEDYRISSGKIEGINQKIKTVRRMSYGLPDTEYFFLKIMDISRQKYVRNPRSCQIPQEM